MPHNHSPRCCCGPHYDGAIVTSAKPCPSCVEHGELATLGNNAPIAAGHCHGPGCDRDYDQRPSPDCPTPGVHDDPTPQPAECPSCHTTNGHPHTDYCQAPNGQRQAAGYPEGHTWGGKIHPRSACIRAWCGWPAQTSQPAATTSQPPTHTR